MSHPHTEPEPAVSHHTHVTAASFPAKRITFYKSGDCQFAGIRMAVHRRNFKCFDALLDDLSQKVPLPFGVRTITTPRGTNTIKHLEQLQDGGCYLCSDKPHAKPINMELANKGMGVWYHHGRRPHRPETSSSTRPGHFSHKQRRILLVKNSDAGVRRSIVLSRRSTRSLRTFLEEASEVMQFQVCKVYTVDGRKINSVQSLMACPGVLVCVGKEPFSPMLVNFIKKSSEEKLPGLDRPPSLGRRTLGNGARSPAIQGARSPPYGAQSRASEDSEGHESKKTLNFGLETKKSIIHPRSDSSNRSTRLSLSSEKSYSVGGFHKLRPAIMNDDIEKRVVVNKDGSLSVEMSVRFRLLSDETVQWSTQIKKSPSLTHDCCPLGQVQPHYFQKNHSESCSDPESISFDPEGSDYSNHMQPMLGTNRCSCCYQRYKQQYNLWKNPADGIKQPSAAPHSGHTNSSSSSLSCNSRRVVHQRTQLSSCGGGSESEQSQLIQKEMCVTESRVEVENNGDTHVKLCRVSRCCSRSEVLTIDDNLQTHCNMSDQENLLMEEERPLSGVSSSSRILQSLVEDQDDEDVELLSSASQCYHSKEPSTSPTPQVLLVDIPSRGASATPLSGASSVCPNCGGCKHGRNSASQLSNHSHQASSKSVLPVCKEDTASPGSRNDNGSSVKSHKSNCPSSAEADCTAEEDDHSQHPGSILSSKSTKSVVSNVTPKEHNQATTQGEETVEQVRVVSSMSTKSNLSVRSNKSIKALNGSLSPRPEGEGEERTRGQMSDRSAVPNESKNDETLTEMIEETQQEPESAESEKAAGAQTASPRRSNSNISRCREAKHQAEDVDSRVEQTASAMSVKSSKSQVLDQNAQSPNREEEHAETQERVANAVSAKSRCSTRSNKSNSSKTLTSVNQEGFVNDGKVDTTKPQDFLCQKLSPQRAHSSRSSAASSSSRQCSATHHLTVHSIASPKSSKSKCHSGTVSATEDCKCETAAESSSSRQHRNESGGTEQPPSQCSSGSVSIRLPEDQDTSHSNFTKSPEGSSLNENADEPESLIHPAVEITTVETPIGSQNKDPNTKTDRAASTFSTKSSQSQKSSCSCRDNQTESVKPFSTNLETPNSRTSSLLSASAKVKKKSLASASTKSTNVAKTHVADSANTGTENQRKSATEEVSVYSKSSFRLSPESASSPQSGSRAEDLAHSDCLYHKAKSKAGSLKSSESPVSQSLSAAAQLKESKRPQSQQSRAKTGSEKCPKWSEENTQKDKQEVTPDCLPNASPNDVVSDWLKRIPPNSSMLGLGEELEGDEQGKDVEARSGDGLADEKESPEDDKMDREEIMDVCKEEEDAKDSDPGPGNGLETSCPKLPQKNWQSSVSVMKILLNSSFGRCRSLPEVSPVYCRRLSTSARDLLDCLAQLQMIQPTLSPARNQQKSQNQQYEDIMDILQSLWLAEPGDIETIQVKDNGLEQVTQRSSSGVGMSSGSGGSGKENLKLGADDTSPKETEFSHENEGAEENIPEVHSEDQSGVPASLDSPKATENSSSPDKTSSKSPTDNEQETIDETSSGTPPTVLQAPLYKRSSQDPDSAWVLQLLKKLEKQFINHYVNAMAEFKVRWDLDDSLILDTMISDLRDEVRQRIQNSIDCEIKKIQSRAGRVRRSLRLPQGEHLSRESTMTVKRRKMLKVMKNQSVKTDSLTDGEMTGDFSDQRSEDEYCPCDACVRKKMAVRPPKNNPPAAEAPVMKEFDLLKILQLNKSSAPPSASQSTGVKDARATTEEEGKSLEIVQEEEEEDEEEEETKYNIKDRVVLEELIPKETEEVEQEEDGREKEEGDRVQSKESKQVEDIGSK